MLLAFDTRNVKSLVKNYRACQVGTDTFFFPSARKKGKSILITLCSSIHLELQRTRIRDLLQTFLELEISIQETLRHIQLYNF